MTIDAIRICADAGSGAGSGCFGANQFTFYLARLGNAATFCERFTLFHPLVANNATFEL
jgi:hypothetical protein